MSVVVLVSGSLAFKSVARCPQVVGEKTVVADGVDLKKPEEDERKLLS